MATQNQDDNSADALPNQTDDVLPDVSPFTSLTELLLIVYDKAEDMAETGMRNNLTTGYSDLDAITGGLAQGHLIIVAGYSGMAKSTLCQNIARQVAIRNEAIVAFFCLEQTSMQTVTRMMAAQAGINPLSFSTGQLREDEWADMAMVVHNIYRAKVAFDERTHKSALDIWEACNQLASKESLGLIIVDSLQLLTDPDGTSDIWETTKILKVMARTLNVPVLAVSHIYTGRTERRENKRPFMSDLAGIDSFADEVFLLHRSSYNETSVDSPEPLDVIIAKQANGPTGLIKLCFLPHLALIADLSHNAEEPVGF